MKPSHVKVMGERASGTNFLTRLISANFDQALLKNTSTTTDAQKAGIQRIPDGARRPRLASERMADFNHLAEMPDTAGWKHACLTDRVFSVCRHADTALFICITRHPALWLRSFYANPMHSMNGDARDLDAFLNTPWVTRARDETADPILPGPGALWAAKVRSYLDQAERRENVIVLRHEDLLTDHAGTLAGLREILGGIRLRWRIPRGYARSWERAEKPDVDFWSIRRDLPERPYETLTPEQTGQLCAQIGTELLHRAGYPPDTPSG